MVDRSWFLAAVSALGGAALFVSPQCFYPIVFVFLVPIFWGVLQHYNLSFVHGFFWGILFFGSNLFAVLVVLHEHADGMLRYAGYVVLVAYFSLYPALWWWGARKIIQRYNWKTAGARAAVWGVTGISMFFVLHHYSFFIFGQPHGLAVANPLITLVYKPLFLMPLSRIGTTGLWFIIIVFQLLLSLVLIHVALYTRLLVVTVLIGVVLCPSCNDKKCTIAPGYFDTVGYLAPPGGEHIHPWDISQEITKRIFELRQRYPQVSIICMPESSCRFALNTHPSITRSWIDAVLHDDCSLLIGSHRTERNKLFNCLYCIQKGPIIFSYDKYMPMPFGEYIPYPWSKIKRMEQLFLNNKKRFCSGAQRSKPLALPKREFSCIPQICYELYFVPEDPGTTATEKIPKNIPILGISNDRWFEHTPYFQHLLLLLVRYRALEWGRPILYIAHTGGWFLSEDGFIVELKNTHRQGNLSRTSSFA